MGGRKALSILNLIPTLGLTPGISIIFTGNVDVGKVNYKYCWLEESHQQKLNNVDRKQLVQAHVKKVL